MQNILRLRAPALAPLRTRRINSVAVHALKERLDVDASGIVGEPLGKWLQTGWDVLSFGPRAGAGALVSMPERLQTLQTDVQRLVELAQDPRPVEEKQEIVRKELEATMLEFLEKGVVVEQDVLSNLKTVLPPEAASALSDLIPDPPNKIPQTGPVVPVDPSDIGMDGMMTSAPTVTYGSADVISVQIEPAPQYISEPPPLYTPKPPPSPPSRA